MATGLGLFGKPIHPSHRERDAGVVDHITWLEYGILPSMRNLQFILRSDLCVQFEKLGRKKSVARVSRRHYRKLPPSDFLKYLNPPRSSQSTNSPFPAPFCFLLPCLVSSPVRTTHAPRASLLPPLYLSSYTHTQAPSEASWACQFRAVIGRPEELTLILQALAGRKRRGGA